MGLMQCLSVMSLSPSSANRGRLQKGQSREGNLRLSESSVAYHPGSDGINADASFRFVLTFATTTKIVLKLSF